VSQQLVEILILGAVALILLGRLFSVLGQRRGSERPAEQPVRRTAPVDVNAGGRPAPPIDQVPGKPASGSGLAALQAADPSFDPGHFLTGGKAAYEMIIKAFADGDKTALKDLLTPRVYEAYAGAIDARAPDSPRPELVRLKSAELAEMGVENGIAHAVVRFEAELAEGATGLRETKERWTFEREISSRNPNWRLSAVGQA
jgi:predicted lipid-binding transport protein (Tim44 family)